MKLKPYRDVIMIFAFVLSILIFIIPFQLLTLLAADLVVMFQISRETFLYSFIRLLAPLLIVVAIFQFVWIKILNKLDDWIEG